LKHKFVKPCLAMSVSIVIAGCATMSPEQCQRANWADLGLQDGLAGESMSVLDARMKDCAKTGIAADTGRYVIGRAQGLQTFCRLENAIPLGLNGGSYGGVCPPMIDVEFRHRFELGRAVYNLRSEVAWLDAHSDRLQHELRDADHDEDRRLREADKDEDRRHIHKEFDEHRYRLRGELIDLDRHLRRKRDELHAAEFALWTFR
jgi:hypothetical protein